MTFFKSFSSELGKNSAKYLSNKLFGTNDWATPRRHIIESDTKKKFIQASRFKNKNINGEKNFSYINRTNEKKIEDEEKRRVNEKEVNDYVNYSDSLELFHTVSSKNNVINPDDYINWDDAIDSLYEVLNYYRKTLRWEIWADTLEFKQFGNGPLFEKKDLIQNSISAREDIISFLQELWESFNHYKKLDRSGLDLFELRIDDIYNKKKPDIELIILEDYMLWKELLEKIFINELSTFHKRKIGFFGMFFYKKEVKKYLGEELPLIIEEKSVLAEKKVINEFESYFTFIKKSLLDNIRLRCLLLDLKSDSRLNPSSINLKIEQINNLTGLFDRFNEIGRTLIFENLEKKKNYLECNFLIDFSMFVPRFELYSSYNNLKINTRELTDSKYNNKCLNVLSSLITSLLRELNLLSNHGIGTIQINVFQPKNDLKGNLKEECILKSKEIILKKDLLNMNWDNVSCKEFVTNSELFSLKFSVKKGFSVI